MKENSNKALAINTLITQLKLVVFVLTGLLSSRWALKALGETDFGLFAVVGGIISFVSVINTTMLASSNRFIALAVGKKDLIQINRTFNVNLIIHILIAVCTLILAIPLGNYYVLNYVNYSGNIEAVLMVFNITIIGSLISFIGVPFNGFLIAKENFWVFSLADIVSHLVKCVVCYLLISYFENKLLVYTMLITAVTAFPIFVYAIYCKYKYPQETQFQYVRDKVEYKKVLSFSTWTGYGAIASVGQSQGAALIINMFFSTVMNTALGVASTISSILQMFVATIVQPMAPQITKCYATHDLDRCNKLLIASSKYSFLLMLVLTTPFLTRPSFFFDLWLGYTPEYSEIFLRLLIINSLVCSLAGSTSTYAFATGDIKFYQILLNSIIFIGILSSYYVLKGGGVAYYYYLCTIGASVLVQIVRMIIFKVKYGFNSLHFSCKVFYPCIIISLCVLPVFYFTSKLCDIHAIIMSSLLNVALTYLLGLSKIEKIYLHSKIKNIIYHVRTCQ